MLKQLKFSACGCVAVLSLSAIAGGCGGGGSGASIAKTASSRIIFESDRDGTSGGDADIYSMNPDGSDVKRLTNNNPVNDFAPSLSHDGKRIVFVSSGREGDLPSSTQLYLMDAQGNNVQRITNSSDLKDEPHWSPDGGKILFTSRQNASADGEIYTINADGSGLTNLTNNPSYDSKAVYSSDGSKILFLTKRGDFGPRDYSSSQIWTMNADGSDPMLLPREAGPVSPSSFRYSPDGSKLLVSGGAGYMGNGDSGVFILNADGSAADARKIADSGDEAVWSPDGSRIAYVGFRDENSEIFTVDSDGKNVRRLTENTKSDVSPSWR